MKSKIKQIVLVMILLSVWLCKFSGNILSISAEESFPEGNSQWERELRRFIYNKEYFSNPRVFYNGNSDNQELSFFDFDQDGVLELIVYTTDQTMAGSWCNVFAYENGKYTYKGDIGFRYCSLFYYPDSKFHGLFCQDGVAGNISTGYYSYQNGTLNSEWVMVENFNEATGNKPKIEQETKNDELFKFVTGKYQYENASPVNTNGTYLQKYKYKDIAKPDWNKTEVTINSDKDDKYTYIFKEDETIEDIVFSTPSNAYNPTLAYILGILSRAVYTRELNKQNLTDMGFTILKESDFDTIHGEEYLADYQIAGKKLDNGKYLVFINIRGTLNDYERFGTDVKIGYNFPTLKAKGMKQEFSFHEGFQKSANRLYYDLLDQMGGEIDTENTVYVLTGHSLGGATANVLQLYLRSSDVKRDNLYCYTYACPNVAVGYQDEYLWNENEMFNNVFNICNQHDPFACMPGDATAFFSIFNNLYNHIFNRDELVKWDKFGLVCWFDGGIIPIKNHDMEEYLKFLGKFSNNFATVKNKVKAVVGLCPVDIYIHDSNNQTIAAVEGGKADYCGFEPGEKALIVTEGDEKIIYLFEDGDYEVGIRGTDSGEMTYIVTETDLNSRTTSIDHKYEGVKIQEGKEFKGYISEKEDSENASLYVVQDGQIVSTVLENGKEVKGKQDVNVYRESIFDQIPPYLTGLIIVTAIGIVIVCVRKKHS